MHQYPRQSPVTASPANSPRTNPTRTNNSRDQEPTTSRAGHERSTSSDQGNSVGDGADAMLRTPENSSQLSEGLGRLNQVVQNYFTKTALIVLHARVHLSPAFAKDSNIPRVNKWFNVEIDETDLTRDQLRIWRVCDAVADRPPPMIIETYIDAGDLQTGQSLVYLDEKGRRWDVEEALNASPSSSGGGNGDGSRPEVILERWVVKLGGGPPSDIPKNLGVLLPRIYKNSIVLFRSLFTCARLLPAWKITKRLHTSRPSTNLPKLRYRISQDPKLDQRTRRDNLTVPLTSGRDSAVENYAFDPIDSPAGPFSIHVAYRPSCDFRIDDSETVLSSRFLGMDEPYVERPQVRRLESAPARRNYLGRDTEIGSLSPQRQGQPSLADQGQAYGSMSTFHGQPVGTSPISALRAARIVGSESPEDEKSKKVPPDTRSAQGSRSSLRSADGPPSVGRRPSVSFMPFKAPSLSASPSQAEQSFSSIPRIGSLGKSSPLAVLSEARHPSGPIPSRGSPNSNDRIRSPSLSSSPKPPAPTRYSSSFGHRKARPSTGGSSKTEDDNSSGKGSGTSSQARTGSGVLAEGGASSGSLQTDDDNISDFLKMLDQKKDLRSFRSSQDNTVAEASTRRTSAALSKFRGMRDSNAALSDSMSSVMYHRSSSSSSRQLTAVPAMVAGTSMSTSSSPGKPISPHTPHTPAIPSRLSANSIVEYARPSSRDRRGERSTTEEQESSHEAELPAPGAIDIPTSPRPFHPSYRRSSSAAQGHRNMPFDDDEIFPLIMRSASLGLDDRPPPSRSSLIGLQEDTSRDESAVANPSLDNRPAFGPSLSLEEPSGSSMERRRSSEGLDQSSLCSKRPVPYRSYIRRTSRGDIRPQSSSSSLMDRANASGTTDQRGGRYSFSRPTSTFEDEEPLLFAMSDFDTAQQSRRSREDLRGGAHALGDSGGSSRRGSRRGGN